MGFSELELEEAMGRFDDGGLAVSLLLVDLPGPSFWKVLSLGDPTRSSDCLAETASFLLVEAVGARASKAGLAGWLFVFETPLLFFSAVARCGEDQLFAV